MPIATLRRVSSVWIVLGFALAAWLRFANAAPFRSFAEWQAKTLGSAFPQSTQLLLALAICVPALAALWVAQRAATPRTDFTSEQQFDRQAAKADTGRLRLNILLALAGMAALGAIGAVLLGVMAPRAKGAPQLVDLSQPASANIKPGAAIISGSKPASAQLRLSISAFGTRGAARFLPVTGGQAGQKPWLIIQLPDDGLTFNLAALPASYRGVLVEDGLPKSVETTLKQKGLLAPRANGHYLVLFTRTADMQRPYWAAAQEMMVLALVLLVFAGLQFWKLRKIMRG